MDKPQILHRLASQLTSRGVENPYAAATAQLEKHGLMKDGQLTEKGKVRNAMSPAERAKDRAAKYSGGKHAPGDYDYNKKTNMATLKR